MFVSIGFAYVFIATISEYRMADALFARRDNRLGDAFLSVIQADAMFPMPFYIRESVASMYMMAQWIPADVIMDRIAAALTNDPYSGHLLWYAVMASIRVGDMESARRAAMWLNVVGPGWPETQNAHAVIAEAQKYFNSLRKQ